MDHEVIVIGGGYAGLSAGALLANRGRKVLLLEKSRHLGGRASYVEKDGYVLEYGLHANRFASQGAAAAVFRKLGRELEFLEPGEPELYRQGAFHPLPNSVGKILRSSLLSPSAKLAAVRALLRLVASSPSRRYQATLEDTLSGCRSPEVRELMRVLSGIGIISPDLAQTSAGEFAAFLKKALRARIKVGYPKGGTRSIVEGLREEVEKNGQVLTASPVTRLVLRKGIVNQVRTESAVFTAPAVVSAIPVREVPDLFASRDLPARLVRKAREMVPTAGIALDLGLRERMSDKSGLLVTSEPLTMGQFTSNIDPDMAPEGRQLLSWYYPLPYPWMRDREKVEREENRLRSLLGEMFPGLWEVVEWERVLRLSMVDGFLPRPGQTREDRPDFTVPGIDNFFLCGDATRAEGTGGDTAFNSALRVSELVEDYLRRREGA